jgi:hypothetical protein
MADPTGSPNPLTEVLLAEARSLLEEAAGRVADLAAASTQHSAAAVSDASTVLRRTRAGTAEHDAVSSARDEEKAAASRTKAFASAHDDTLTALLEDLNRLTEGLPPIS